MFDRPTMRMPALLSMLLVLTWDVNVMASNSPTDTDLVVALCSSTSRLPMALGSRAWRRTIPAVYSIDLSVQQLPPSLHPALMTDERLVTFPDSVSPTPGTPADRRWAMTPLLAWRALLNSERSSSRRSSSMGMISAASSSVSSKLALHFKWMLFGDDDTVFLIPGVRHLLQHLDPALPYFLTDALLCPPRFPDCRHLVCNPCPRPVSNSSHRNMQLNTPVLQACDSCSPKALCQKHHPKAQKRCIANHRVWFYGGAGAIISAGLFLQLHETGGWETYELCVKSKANDAAIGGDAILAECLWQVGFPITTPEGVHFGKPPRQSYFDGLSWLVLAKMPGLLLTDDRKHGSTQSGHALQLHMPDLEYAVSMHVSQAFLNHSALPGHPKTPLFQAAAVRTLVASYELARLALETLQNTG